MIIVDLESENTPVTKPFGVWQYQFEGWQRDGFAKGGLNTGGYASNEATPRLLFSLSHFSACGDNWYTYIAPDHTQTAFATAPYDPNYPGNLAKYLYLE